MTAGRGLRNMGWIMPQSVWLVPFGDAGTMYLCPAVVFPDVSLSAGEVTA